MTKIGVVSDTHIPYAAKSIPDIVLKKFSEEKVSLIFHAGDVVREEALYDLMGIAEVEAVHGNMDEADMRENYPDKKIISVEDVKILLVHGWGDPYTLPYRLLEVYRDLKVDAIVFGHSHVPFNDSIEGIYLFNPGTPTDRIYAKRRSFGIIEVDGKDIRGRIIYID